MLTALPVVGHPSLCCRVQGEVVRWQVDAGPEVTPAVQYIEQLEREVASLREQISEQATALELLGGNEVMDYLKTLSPQQLQELTGRAGDDVLEAMNTFIQRLLGELVLGQSTV